MGTCTNGDELGFTKNGGLAEFCAVDMRHLWSIKPLQKVYGDTVELFLAGSLIEPHAGVFKAIRESSFAAGDSVLVLGLGTIGLSAVNIFRALGAGKIIGYDPRTSSHSVAKILGVSSVYNPHETFLVNAVHQETHGEGVEIIFEASGFAEKNWSAITCLLEQGPQNTQLIFFGQSKVDLSINPQPFIQKYLRFSGSHGHTKVWKKVISLITAERIHPMPLITSCISLAEVPQYLRSLSEINNQIKVSVLL